MKFVVVLSALFAFALCGATPDSACVSIGKTELFCIYAADKGLSVTKRAEAATKAIEEIMADPAAMLDSIYIAERNGKTVIKYKDLQIITVLAADTVGTGAEIEKLAADWIDKIKKGIIRERERSFGATNLAKLALGIFFPFLIIVAYIFIHKLYIRLSKAVVKKEGSTFRGIKLRGLEFIPPSLEINIILKILLFLKWVVLVLILYALILIFFTLFPVTRAWTETILTASIEWLKGVGGVFVDILIFIFLAVFLYIVAKIFWGLADMVLRRYEASPSNARIPAGAIDPLRRTIKCAIAFLFVVSLIAVIPGHGEYAALSLLLIGAVFAGIAALPFISSVIAGIAISLSKRLSPGDIVALGDQKGEVIHIGLIWTKIAVEDFGQIVFLNSYFITHPFAVKSQPLSETKTEQDNFTK